MSFKSHSLQREDSKIARMVNKMVTHTSKTASNEEQTIKIVGI